MSITGKNIAIHMQSIMVAKAIANTEIEAVRHRPVVAISMRMQVASSCHAIVNSLMNTPHQYFNANGKIDKRKKRKHDRKMGLKPHTSRLIRVKVVTE